MPTKLALHKISIPGRGRKSKPKKTKKPKNQKLTNMDIDKFIVKKFTTHAIERLKDRCELTERQIAIDIKKGLKTVHYCEIHKDIRIIGIRFTYHFGSISGNLITLYPTNKDDRQQRNKYHNWTPKKPEDIRYIFVAMNEG